MRAVSLTWPGGTHPFALPLGALRSLQEARDAGPEEILNRLRAGRWQADDLIQVLRWGLVGGGMAPDKAAQLVTPLIDLHPLSEFKLPALAVLAAALFGVEDDPVGEDAGAAETPPENGSSPSSTAPAP
jgi:hypothetical protein